MHMSLRSSSISNQPTDSVPVTPPPSAAKPQGRLLPTFDQSDSDEESSAIATRPFPAHFHNDSQNNLHLPSTPLSGTHTNQHNNTSRLSFDHSFDPLIPDIRPPNPDPQPNVVQAQFNEINIDQNPPPQPPPNMAMANPNIPSTLLPSPFTGKSKDDIEIFLAGFDLYAQLHNWNDAQKAKTIPLLFKEEALLWYTGLDAAVKDNFAALKEALLTRFKPHESLKWVRLRQFQMKRQQPLESVESYFEDMRRIGTSLNKTIEDITDTTVGGLLPAISKFVMVRAPQNWDEALDMARRASILEDPKDGKIEVALAILADKFDQMDRKLGQIENGTRQRIPRPQPPFKSDNYPSQYNKIGFNSHGQNPQFNQRRYDQQTYNPQGMQSRPMNPFRRSNPPCRACGNPNHSRDDCRFKNVQCRACLKVGHIQRICRSIQNSQ